MQDLSAQTGGFERALGRFFQACAADRNACRDFGGTDPWDAYDALIDQADAQPDPAAGYAGSTLDQGDDVSAGTAAALYSKCELGRPRQGDGRRVENGDGSG